MTPLGTAGDPMATSDVIDATANQNARNFQGNFIEISREISRDFFQGIFSREILSQSETSIF